MSQTSRPTLRRIVAAAAVVTNTPVSILSGRGHAHVVSRARQLLWLAAADAGHGPAASGRAIGRTHATVTIGLARLRARLARDDDEARDLVRRVEKIAELARGQQDLSPPAERPRVAAPPRVPPETAARGGAYVRAKLSQPRDASGYHSAEQGAREAGVKASKSGRQA